MRRGIQDHTGMRRRAQGLAEINSYQAIKDKDFMPN
jgi:hypothetical protein